MADDIAKQAKYAASRAKHGIPRPVTIEYRVTLRDGREFVEHTSGLAEVAVLWPDAVRVERVDEGGFW